jgi:hypothetical protein
MSFFTDSPLSANEQIRGLTTCTKSVLPMRTPSERVPPLKTISGVSANV